MTVKHKNEIATGDAIEVEFSEYGATFERHIWKPATVQLATDWQIVAVFADGTRKAIPRDAPHWRVPS